MEVRTVRQAELDQYVSPPRSRARAIHRADPGLSSLADFDKSLDQTKAVYTLEQSENQEFGAVAVLECRGCEIVAFDPKVSAA
jgi:hypothetical protein